MVELIRSALDWGRDSGVGFWAVAVLITNLVLIWVAGRTVSWFLGRHDTQAAWLEDQRKVIYDQLESVVVSLRHQRDEAREEIEKMRRLNQESECEIIRLRKQILKHARKD